MRRSIPIAVIGILFVVASARCVSAACNSAPSASEVDEDGSQLPPSLLNFRPQADACRARSLAQFRYKGELGRINDAYFFPALDDSLYIAPDDICVGSPTSRTEPRVSEIADFDRLAIFVIFDTDRGGPITVWPYLAAPRPTLGLGTLSSTLNAKLKLGVPSYPRTTTEKRDVAVRGASSVRFVTKDWDRRVQPYRAGDRVVGARIPLPDMNALRAASARPALTSSSVRIVAIETGDKDVEDIAKVLLDIYDNGCESACEPLQKLGVKVCITKIYTQFPREDGSVEYREDPLLCSVDIPTDPSGNERGFNLFHQVCEADPTAPHDPSLAKCNEPPANQTLWLWQSDCGAIHVPFDWTDIRIRQTPEGSKSVTREVDGRSGVGRARDADNRRIWIPGREFVGSTHRDDPSDCGTYSRWRLPSIDVFYPDGPETAELGLSGAVDQDNSIVHIFPRRPAVLLCKDGFPRACMKVEEHAGIACSCPPGVTPCECVDSRRCSSGDRKGTVCMTNDDCASAAPGGSDGICEDAFMHFACNGGDREDMPCTNDDHCKRRTTGGTDGRCTRQPRCQPAGAVFRSGAHR